MKRGSVVPAILDAGQWSACFGLSWTSMMLHDVTGPNRIIREGGTYLRKVCGTGGIPQGRNEVAASFLDGTDGEWLFMVDTDMGFDAGTVDALVDAADEHRRPVMGGLCFALRRTGTRDFHADTLGVIPTIYDYVESGSEVGFRPVERYPRGEVAAVAGTGAACLLVHRRALRKVRDRYGDTWFDPITHPDGLGPGKPRTFSEDLSFCVRLQACDIPVHVHTGVRTCHEKGGVYLDEWLYDQQQAAAAAATGGEVNGATRVAVPA